MAEQSTLENLGKLIETDVLIVGCGPSGLWASIKAKPLVDKVIVVDKGPTLGPTNQGYFSGGGVDACPPEEVDKLVEELVYFEDGLIEQDVVAAIAMQSFDRIREFERFGVKFFREPDGSLRPIPQRGLKYAKCYLGEPFGAGGLRQTEALINEAKRLGVEFMKRIFVTDVLVQDGKAVGVVAFDSRTGQFLIFRAKAVVLCSGHCNLKGHYEDQGMATGDGTAMCLKAGAELKNMEFITNWIVPKLFGWEGVTYLLPMGARFINARGEEFVNKYSPMLKSNCDYNFLVKFMALEAREGRGPFYVDCSLMKPRDREMMEPIGGWTELQYHRMLEMGIRFFDEPTEWMPGFQGTMGGSVRTNIKMETAVPGLYAAGRLRNTDAGVYMGGWALCTSAAYGCWAGENAAKYARASKSYTLDADKIKALKEEIYRPMGKVGLDAEQAILEIQKAMFPYDVMILKSGKNLKKSLKKIEYARDEMLPNLVARDAHGLKKLIETRNMTVVAECMLRASLMRTESRASQYREDYPNRDNENWLKWIIINQKDGKLNLYTVPVPFEKYPYKPTRYYMDNFILPK